MTLTTALISTASELEDFCSQLQDDAGIAIDTEFMRQNTFYAIPAVVQIAQQTSHGVVSACIDAPKIKDWCSLKNQLESAPFCIAHSPDQDFEIFDQLFGKHWNFTIYDTQVAAALLGQQPQISYAKIIQLILGLEIDKSQSRTDWLRRPLNQAQIDYALADVIHLTPTWNILKTQLHELGRLDWFYADTKRATSEHQYSHSVNKAWASVKGIKRLEGKAFAIAASLALWREEKAMQADIPRRWMLADDVILDLAEGNKQVHTAKVKWAALRKSQDFVENLIKSPMQEFVDYPTQNFLALNADEKAHYKELKSFCNTKAEELKLDPGVIANRKTLEKIVRGNTGFLDLGNWRHVLLHDYLKAN